jgi:hypothetical protein
VNEIALDSVFASDRFWKRLIGTKQTRQSSTFYSYTLLTIAIGAGWLLRDHGLVNPEKGVGYWLGIIGASMMLLLLLYPLRKRLKRLGFLGSTRNWFRTHMILGLLGPLLILYHANFQLGSFNSRVALYCMLLVAGSGVIGRHIDAHVHRGLYGGKLTLTELQGDLASSLESSQGLANLLPKLTGRLNAVSAEVQGDQYSGSLSTGASLKWKLRYFPLWFSLRNTAKRELQARAAESPAIARDLERLTQSTNAFIRRFIHITSKIAQFTLYEKLLSAWHILHMPLFIMMIISALLHVLAVHMY